MNSTLYVFLPSTKELTDYDVSLFPSLNVKWVIRETGRETQFSQGGFSDIAKISHEHTVLIIIPGQDCLYLTASIPGKNQQQIQQAVPYVLEDSFIDDVDNLHFALSDKAVTNEAGTEKKYQVLAINKAYMDFISRGLLQSGIQADAVTADFMLLSQENTLLIDNHRAIYGANETKFSIELSSLKQTAHQLLNQNEQIQMIIASESSDVDEELSFLTDNPNIENNQCNNVIEVCLVEKTTNMPSINLLQNKYKKKRNWSKTSNTWLPVAILFLVWLSIQSILFFVDYIKVKNESARLNNQINQIYKKTFPDARRIVNAKAQMQQKLESLKKRKGKNEHGFTEMLAGSANILSKTPGLLIKTLRYYDGSISLDLQLSTLQDLDKLKTQLTAQNKYSVEIKNASSDKNFVNAQLQIVGGDL